MSPCLQTFVVALPASGKGVLSLVRLLAEPIHDEIREQVDESMACYRREKAKTSASQRQYRQGSGGFYFSFQLR